MTVSMGGSSANIAAGICKFGGKSALVTRVSDDAVGRYCVGQLNAYGVDTQYVTPIVVNIAILSPYMRTALKVTNR